MDMTKGQRIEHAIAESGHTPASMSRLIDCTSAAIYQWISGQTKDLRNDLLFALADATGFNARWIATGNGPPRPQEDERARKLTDIFTALDERGKSAVFRVAESESTYNQDGPVTPKRSA